MRIFQKLPEGVSLNKDKEALLVEIANVGYDATGRNKKAMRSMPAWKSMALGAAKHLLTL